MAQKVDLGRLELPEPLETFVPRTLASQGFKPLPVSERHAIRVAALPRHHDDLVDRLLVAQAQVEGLTLVTADPQLLQYDVETLWAGSRAPGRSRSPRRSST
jgi:PIN domain nuclease of toxin-antitoxin system